MTTFCKSNGCYEPIDPDAERLGFTLCEDCLEAQERAERYRVRDLSRPGTEQVGRPALPRPIDEDLIDRTNEPKRKRAG